MENKKFRRCILLFILISAVGMTAYIISHGNTSFPISKEQENRSEYNFVFVEQEDERLPDSGYAEQEDIEELVLNHATQIEISEAGEIHGLKKLSISVWDDDVDLSPISNLTELEELTLSIYNREIDASALEDINQLTSLIIYDAWTDLSFIKKLSNLREVFIQKSDVEDLSIFADLTKLRKLYIEYVDDTDLTYLENLTALEEIHLCGGHIRNMEYIKNLRNLKELYLYESTDIYDEQPEAETVFLSGLDKLETLTIVHMDIDDLEAISEITSLRWMALGCTGITDIMPLKKLKNLEYLGVFGNDSETVKKQAGQYFNNINGLTVDILEELPVTL